MQSLRTRRPSALDSKPQRSPSSKLYKQPTTKRAARQSTKVDDRIKKRMSMRYATISGPTPTENIPAVPVVPATLRAGHSKESENRGSVALDKEKQREEAKIAENKLLDKQDFDPDAFIKIKLAGSTEAEMLFLQSQLRTSKDEVAADLQRNVFKNYADFMFVSKEISTLENEMLEFKESLAEWKNMPSLLHIDESSSVADRRRNVRSSIADLRILYANQMQTLHSKIEGSAKYVPTMPGRHIITEVDGILALNTATYKVVNSVKFVLLDDALLVARRRKRNNAESEKLVAERCWMLNDMLVLDTKDTPVMTNVFKIKHGKETHVFRTEVAADKKSLLVQFRQIAEELATKKRKEREGENERRKSLWANGEQRLSHSFEKLPSMPDWMAELAQKAGPMAISGTNGNMEEQTEGDVRWIGDFADDLTVAIAFREWDQAVALVEQGELKLSTMPTLSTKLAPLKASLTSAILYCLSAIDNRKTTVVNLISYLLRLGAGAAARSTFLSARSEVTKKRVRMIRFEGAVELYINDLAIVIFTSIKHTADWFLASFKENEAASCFIDWAKGQVVEYSTMFRKQVYTPDVDSKTVEDSLAITYNQSKKLLEEYGLDFRFLLQDLLAERPKSKDEPGINQPKASSSFLRAQARAQLHPIITQASANSRPRSPQPLSSLNTSTTPFLTVPGARSQSLHPEDSDDRLRIPSSPKPSPIDSPPKTSFPVGTLPSPDTPTLPSSINAMFTSGEGSTSGSGSSGATLTLSPTNIRPINRALSPTIDGSPASAVPRTLKGGRMPSGPRSNPGLRSAAATSPDFNGVSMSSIPPPRSWERPSSGSESSPGSRDERRTPPAAVPKRDGMI